MFVYYLYIIGGVVVASLSQLLLKKGADRKYPSVLREYLNPYVICGYGMLLVSTILVILGFQGLDYKNGPVLESLAFVFVFLLSILILKEKATPRRIIGNILIVVGVVVFYL